MKKKILILKLGAMGDVVHTTVIATAIKEKHPDWQIDLLTTEAYAKVIIDHPHIDNIIFWDASKRKSYKYLFQVAYDLFKNQYDVIFNLTRAFRNNLLARLAFPKKVINKMNFNTNWVEEYFLTAKSFFKEIELPERLYLGTIEACEKIDSIFAESPKPIFVIAPGGATDKHRQGRIWNIQNWKKLCEKINSEYGGTILITGSKKEVESHQVLDADYIKITTGNLDTTELSYALSKADMMISGDSGPAHIAAAHNVKTLTLLGSTTADKIKPYGKNGYSFSSEYQCLGCWKKKCNLISDNETYTPCMEAIKVEDVFEKIKEIYNKS